MENQKESPAAQAKALAKKLQAYKHTNTLVVSTTSNAYDLATGVAQELELNSAKNFCKALKHPGNPHRTIGSVTAQYVVLDNETTSLPRDYIQHQIVMLRHAISKEEQAEPQPCKNKNVIIVREELNNPDEVKAVIEQLKTDQAAAIIIAVPVINRETLVILEKNVSEIVYMDIQHHTGLWLNPYSS